MSSIISAAEAKRFAKRARQEEQRALDAIINMETLLTSLDDMSDMLPGEKPLQEDWQ